MIMSRILTIHLAALMLVSNVGIPVFTHICHTQAKSWSSLYIPAKSCCSKKKHSSFTIPCHNSTQDNSAEIKSRPCCENQGGLLQLSDDFLRSHISNPGDVQIQACHDVFEFASSFLAIQNYSFIQSYKSHGPPITLYGRSLLISQQVFRC